MSYIRIEWEEQFWKKRVNIKSVSKEQQNEWKVKSKSSEKKSWERERIE